MALDFQIIKTDDPTKLIIADMSDWTGLTGSEVDILCPEGTTVKNFTLNKNVINTFLVADLNPEGTRLSDGIYEITVKDTAGTTTTKETYLRTTYLRLERDKIFLKDINWVEEVLDKVSTVDLFLDAAYANLREGDIIKTKYFYNGAKDKITKIQNCN